MIIKENGTLIVVKKNGKRVRMHKFKGTCKPVIVKKQQMGVWQE